MAENFWLYLLSPWYHSTRNATLRLACLDASEVSVLRRFGERMLFKVARVGGSGSLGVVATLLRKLTPGLPRVLYCNLRGWLVSRSVGTPARRFKKVLIGIQCAPNSKSLCESLELPMYA